MDGERGLCCAWTQCVVCGQESMWSSRSSGVRPAVRVLHRSIGSIGCYRFYIQGLTSKTSKLRSTIYDLCPCEMLPTAVRSRAQQQRISRQPAVRSIESLPFQRRRASLLVVRFKPELVADGTNEGLTVPIDCCQVSTYSIDETSFARNIHPMLQLLGFKPGSVPKNNEVSQAYQALLGATGLEGYSQATLDCRQELLGIAKSDIIGIKTGMMTDRQHAVTIPYHLVPGALAVLVEVNMIFYSHSHVTAG